MVIKDTIGRMLNAVLKPWHYRVVNTRVLFDWQTRGSASYSYSRVELPKDAEDYLTVHNDRLLELTRLYAQMDAAVITPSTWTKKHLRPVDLRYFRGDNPYVWQLKDGNFESAFATSTYYVKSIDTLSLLERLKEDNEFGVYTYRVDNKVVSRDLLDSIVEIYFLEKHLGISRLPRFNLLDIGAGYGRLAHRLVAALPNVERCFCTDAIPASTFICEYYLRFRKVNNRASAVPLHEVEAVMASHPIDIAVNIHSFSECTVAAVDWWLRALARHRVRYLMIVPDRVDIEDSLLAGDNGEDILPLVERNGYRLLVREPKYRDPAVQRCGVSPTHHYLFELR